jgi:hypothetical protein
VDPELEALPTPSRRERTLAVTSLGLAVLASLVLAFMLRRDVAYALSSRRAAFLGDLSSVTTSSLAAHENRLVSGSGLLGAAGGLRYERPFRQDTFRTLPILGRVDLWIEVRVPAGQEGGRWVPPRAFMGRLERFGATGPSHQGLRSSIELATGAKLSEGSWLLVDGEDLADARRAIVLSVLLLGLAAYNALGIARIIRRVP